MDDMEGDSLRMTFSGHEPPRKPIYFEAIAGSRISSGLVVAPDVDSNGKALTRCSLQRSAHPIPDARSERAGLDAISLVASPRRNDVLVALISFRTGCVNGKVGTRVTGGELILNEHNNKSLSLIAGQFMAQAQLPRPMENRRPGRMENLERTKMAQYSTPTQRNRIC